MMESDGSLLVHIITSIPPTLLALGALLASLRNHEQGSKTLDAVNGNSERLKRELEDARRAVRLLEKKLDKMRERRRLDDRTDSK